MQMDEGLERLEGLHRCPDTTEPLLHNVLKYDFCHAVDVFLDADDAELISQDIHGKDSTIDSSRERWCRNSETAASGESHNPESHRYVCMYTTASRIKAWAR